MSTENEFRDLPTWLDRETFPFRSRQLRILDHNIHYIDEGNGPVLLLLHGNGSWSFGFRLTVPTLSARFRVIALDYPGFGLSTPKAGFSFKPKDHSVVVEAFVDELKLQNIRLFVEDWGGPIGLGLAGRRPELIHSIIISNTWAWPAQGSPQLERFSALAGSMFGRFLITRFNVLARIAVPMRTIARNMTEAEKRGYYMPYPTVESRLPQAIFPREILESHAYLAEVENGLANLVDKPVLIIWGELDPGFTPMERQRFLKHWKNASVVLLPHAKHFVHVDEPEATCNAIVAFETGEIEDCPM